MVVNVEKDAVPKIGEAGPAVDSGYVDPEISDMVRQVIKEEKPRKAYTTIC